MIDLRSKKIRAKTNTPKKEIVYAVRDEVNNTGSLHVETRNAHIPMEESINLKEHAIMRQGKIMIITKFLYAQTYNP